MSPSTPPSTPSWLRSARGNGATGRVASTRTRSSQPPSTEVEMRTPLCDVFGIEYPIFAFTHCRDVVAAVSKAGGLGVLGAVGFSPDQLEIELSWIDEHVGGKPYGVDTVMPQKAVDVHGADAADMLAQIRSMIDANHWRYVDELMERFELPPMPEGEEPHGVLGWTDDVAHAHVETALAHP